MSRKPTLLNLTIQLIYIYMGHAVAFRKIILICLNHSFRRRRLEIRILGRVLMGLEEMYTNSELDNNCRLV
jgi:hypothetical protein